MKLVKYSFQFLAQRGPNLLLNARTSSSLVSALFDCLVAILYELPITVRIGPVYQSDVCHRGDIIPRK